MKIKRIEFNNFRNFMDPGSISFSTDGKVTIVYGKNGDGKTTLHQLFQWIFYGKTHFNNTTTDKLYNLSYESKKQYGDTFEVLGRIEFDHDNCSYSMTRTQTYKKGLDESSKIKEEVTLLKLDEGLNWRKVDGKISDVIDRMLPSGLSEYFFFDGESMIADLGSKSSESATKLRKALYSMFDLDKTDQAIKHIGKTDLKSTVLGKLFIDRGSTTSDEDIRQKKHEVESAQSKLGELKLQCDNKKQEKEDKEKIIRRLSEDIGESKSKDDYERRRNELKRQSEIFADNAKDQMKEFGEEVSEVFPKLLISKSINDAQKRIKLKISNNNLPVGVTKPLIDYLIKEKICICGRPIGDDEIAILESYLNLLPPQSFALLYNQFISTAKNWGRGYDKQKLENYIQGILTNQNEAFSCEQKIANLDEEMKHQRKDIEDLIVDRQKAEQAVSALDEDIIKLNQQIYKYEFGLRKLMSQYEELTNNTERGKEYNEKIKIMEAVRKYFENKLASESETYSVKLKENIQKLFDIMSTTKRKVSVSKDFAVSVFDSYNDESKSEGQFAMFSFAYIGGILQMLKGEPQLINKEYPLILDGPFSKLDPDQRQNVIDNISSFANQVVLFSKEDLHEFFDDNNIGHVWHIYSNDEKNVAYVKEGYAKEYFANGNYDRYNA